MTIDFSSPSALAFHWPRSVSNAPSGDRSSLLHLWPELAPWWSGLVPLKDGIGAFFLGTIRPTTPMFGRCTARHATISHLLDSYTGDGIHIFAEAGRLNLFPTGTGTLFFHPQPNGISIATHLRTLVSSGRICTSANIDYALGHLVGMTRDGSNTPFTGIFRVPAGHALILNESGKFDLVDVFPEVTSDDRVDIAAFVAMFKSILRAEIEQLAALDGSLTLSLSGGHDSTLLALIAGEAKRADISLRAITCFDSRFSEGDERDIAKSTATRIGADLTCLDLARHRPFESFHQSPPPDDFTAKTNLESYYREVDEITSGSHILNGMGGDSLFLEFPNDSALLSAIGSPAVFARLCRVVAPRQKLLAPIVAANALCRWLRAQMVPRQELHRNFARVFDNDTRHMVKTMLVASRRRSRISFDFRRQAERLYLREAFYFLNILATGNSAYRVAAYSPYLSTASIRALMGVPVHFHLGSEKRAIEKRILRSLDYDPASLRTSKGFITSSVHAGISEHHEKLRALCSGGVLSEHLDQSALATLWNAQLAGSLDATPVLGKLIEVESFYLSYRN